MARFAQPARRKGSASRSGQRARNVLAALLTASIVIAQWCAGLSARARFFAFALVAALAVTIVAFALRQPVERRVVSWIASGATGFMVDVGEVQPENGAIVLRDVHARSQGGAVLVDAGRIALHWAGSDLQIAADAPRLGIVLERWRGDERARLLGGLARYGFARDRIDLRLIDGSAYAIGTPLPVRLAWCDAITGTVQLERGRTTYDVTLALHDGSLHYPVAGSAAAGPDGMVTHRWYAAALPLTELSGLVPRAAEVSIEGGWLRDLTLASAASIHATATVEHVALGIVGRNGRRHVLRELGGSVTLDGSGIGSNGVRGTIDDIPIDAVGEVHDFPAGWDGVHTGSNDLRSLARLAVETAEEPGVQAVHLETTAPGVAFAQYALTTDHGPLAVQVLSVDPREPTLSFNTAIAGDHIISGGERTSAMGVRTGAVAGVNGDYFDIGRTYQPQGMLLRSGRLLRGPTDRFALVLRGDRSVSFAEYRMLGTVRVGNTTFPVTQLNNWPAGNVTVITPDFGKTLPPASGIRFAELTPLGGDRFRIARVASTDAPQPVHFGLAFGPKTSAVLRPGEKIELQYRLEPAIGDAVAGIGGGPLLLKDGAWFEDPHAPAPDERDVRWPVVALGRQRDGNLLLVAVDGRHPERSVGMKRPEFGALLQRLDVTDAMALDSGGSVTMVSRAPGDRNVTVRNVPSDFSAERWVSDGLFIYSSAPAPVIIPQRSAPTPVPEARPTP